MENQIEVLIAENEKLREQIEKINLPKMEKTIKDLTHENKSLKGKNNYLKGSITREVNAKLLSEKVILENKQKELNDLKYDLERKETIINNFDISELNSKIKELDNLNEAIIESLPKSFDKIKGKIIQELSEEFERFSEKNSNDDRACGYLIGINKAKKIIRENLKVNYKELKKINEMDIQNYIISRTYGIREKQNLNIINNFKKNK